MSSTSPRYLFLPDGSEAESLRERLGALLPLREVRSEAELLDRGGEDGPPEPGWILLPPGIDPPAVLSLLLRLADQPGAWSPLLVIEGDDGGLSLIPLSPGLRYPLDEAVRRLEGEVSPALLSFRVALEEASRLRHDINNPLTAAMAEVQLLLMDLEAGSEFGSALGVVEDQLRRIRDLVAQLSGFRAPLG